jgi:hypothetical protein
MYILYNLSIHNKKQQKIVYREQLQKSYIYDWHGVCIYMSVIFA